MNKETITSYSYLWDGSSRGWALLRAPELLGGFCVFNKINRMLLHIESGSDNEAVCIMMKEAGCEILNELPPENSEDIEWIKNL